MVVVGAAGAHNGDSLVPLILAASIGATLGDSVGWLIGRHGARPLLERWSWARTRTERQMTQARAYFERRGGAAVFLGRFVGAFRAVISVVAGMSGMPFPRFLAWNIAASIAWTTLVVSLGYFVGENADSLVGDLALIVALAVIAGVGLWVAIRRFRGRGPSSPTEATEPGHPRP